MIKNIIFDIGGVVAEEVNGRALTHLTAAKQEQVSDLLYYKSPGFIEVLLGNESSADYSAKMIEEYPNLEREISFLFDPKTCQPHIQSNKGLWTYYINYTMLIKSIFCQTRWI